MSNTTRAYFARTLARLREAKGLSQEQLGARVGCTQGRISIWEKGKNLTAFPKAQQIDQLAAALGVPPAALFPGGPISDPTEEQMLRVLADMVRKRNQ